jgi:hypothetical protein
MKVTTVFFRILLILSLSLISSLPVAAQVDSTSPLATQRYVSPYGTDSGGCTNPANPCQSVNYARSQSISGDTIHLAAGEYVENISLFVAVNLEGAGAEATIINANDSGTALYVFSHPDPLTVSHLTLRNGSSTYGAGLVNLSTITLDHVIIADNQVSDQGGGIYNEGNLTMLNCVVRSNTSTGVAAGMINRSAAVIRNSAFFGNIVPPGSGYAGGIHNNTGASLELTNVTFSGNQSAQSTALSNSGTAVLTNVTIADNVSYNDWGGGIGYFASGSVKNSILSNNVGGNCGEKLPSSGSNIDSGASCGFTQPGDMQDTLAKLKPFAHYNSFIPTYNLFPDSPAIDSANPAFCPGTDARGVTRPLDGDGIGGAVCDRGAHEYNPQTDQPKVYLPLAIKN